MDTKSKKVIICTLAGSLALTALVYVYSAVTPIDLVPSRPTVNTGTDSK
jgi:hypothetical protein